MEMPVVIPVKDTGTTYSNIEVILVIRCSRYLLAHSVAEPEPVLFGRSRSGCKGPASSTLDKTDEIQNNILFVSSHVDKKLFKKQILVHK